MLRYLVFGNMPVFIRPKEFSNTGAGTDELLCSAASIATHVVNIYSYKLSMQFRYPAIPQ